MTDSPAAPIRESLPVTVLLERRLIERKFWSLPSWRLAGVAVGRELTTGSPRGECVRETEKGATWAWSGYSVILYRDACERYWHALIGDQPKVYVVCREQANTDQPLRPLIVTIDYDEATAFVETDELVLTAPIPGELYRSMERFVLQHYRPKAFKKRKRRNWSETTPADADAADDPAKSGRRQS